MSAALARFARDLASRSPVKAHHAEALTALTFSHLLTEGEQWLCHAFLRLRVLSEAQTARLHEIAAKVERGRA